MSSLAIERRRRRRTGAGPHPPDVGALAGHGARLSPRWWIYAAPRLSLRPTSVIPFLNRLSFPSPFIDAPILLPSLPSSFLPLPIPFCFTPSLSSSLPLRISNHFLVDHVSILLSYPSVIYNPSISAYAYPSFHWYICPSIYVSILRSMYVSICASVLLTLFIHPSLRWSSSPSKNGFVAAGDLATSFCLLTTH